VYLGNKADLPGRAIAEADLQMLCVNLLDGPYFLTSALTGENGEAAFNRLAERVEQV
jgi:hypothetical protein